MIDIFYSIEILKTQYIFDGDKNYNFGFLEMEIITILKGKKLCKIHTNRKIPKIAVKL